MTGRKRRQELYERIRKSSREQVILEEMVKTGFWKGEKPRELIERRGELTRELRELTNRQRKYADREAMLREMRQRRMKEARENREETKQRREAKRLAKARRWEKRQSRDILYLGEGVSAGLTDEPGSVPKFSLPTFENLAELATLLGITVGELRFLSFHRLVSKVSHYKRFLLPKKRGGHRVISAPMPRLKAAQHAVLEKILYQVPIHLAAHGFVPERSILTNARPHVGKALVINMDLKDFFPTVTFPRVKGVFRALGYSEKIATVLGLLCTEPEADEVELDGQRYFVHTSQRRLPQGAPTSPALTNILCHRLDRRLQGIADQLGFTYTRYADDLTFSGDETAAGRSRQLLWRCQAVIKDEGFTLHPDKLRFMRRGSRQEVTGLTVNDRVAIPRDDLRRFRALVFQLEKDGVEGKHWNQQRTHLLAAVRGYANFIHMVHPEKSAELLDRVQNILDRAGWTHEIRHPAKPDEPELSPQTPTEGKPLRSLLQKLAFWKK